MKRGAAIFCTDQTPAPDEIARLVEARGYESLWLPEHTHIPSSRETPYPAGGELPEMYSRTLDPFVALTAAAVATRNLIVATGICLVNQRDPILTAKEVASLDRLSGGRFIFGVGAGWNREEMANHGVDPRRRMQMMSEKVEAMQAIWTQEVASYAGEFVSFEQIWCWPKPVQHPWPQVLVGGNGPTVEDRVLRFGDGWMPNVIDDDELLGRIAGLRERAGRAVPISINASPRRPERLARYVEAGVERAIFYLPTGSLGEIEQRLDDLDASWSQLGFG